MRRERDNAGIDSPATPRQRGKACERCWKRKQKCDRNLPACSACKNVGQECTTRRFDVEPITNAGGNLSHSVVPSYVNTLKKKRESLQKQLRHKRPRQADASNAEQLETAPVQSSEKAGHEKEQETTEHTVEAAMGEIGFLSRSAMAEPRNERDEDPQELATGRMLRAALAITGANPIESRIDALQQVVGGMADQSFSLKRPLVTPFVSRFLDTEGIRFLHINSTHLWEDVEEFFSEPGSSHSRVFKASPARLFNFYLAIATGMLVSPQSASLQGLACSIHAAAVRLFSTIAQSENNANILSCMISMVLFSMHSPLGGSTWHLVGLAMKKAIAFGFHKASKQNAGISEYPETLIAEYHIFWDLYTLDRNISAIMDRPFGIEDDDITVPPPDEYLSSPSDEHRLALRTVMHARLISGIRNCPSESLVFHYNNFADWRDIACEHAYRIPAVHTLQLKCRAIVEILKTKRANSTSQSLICSPATIESDFLESCVEYIQEAYRQSELDNYIGGTIEAFDIFAAGIVILCLRDRFPQICRDQQIVNKCTTLLTLLGERFSGLKGFRRTLWDISNATSIVTIPGNLINNLPIIVPDGLRSLIQGVL